MKYSNLDRYNYIVKFSKINKRRLSKKEKEMFLDKLK